ncbi:ParA family protein [Pseudomonas sp. GD03721]|nr:MULTISPECIES: ParA family protein [unclassified Pseudomonas]MDH1440355.1 ParA family protein [Pseudomonas sp. GD03722]WGG03555.1 ParA family protein [Pseudomonas sp. GD03721]WGG07723.1 ParA family protein [Pseudomonas sp. GD03919]
MRAVAVISTKGGVGKTTVVANLGGLLADAGLRVLLLDLDSQPTLSSYYALRHKAVAGAYELIALNQAEPEQVVSTTAISGLDLIASNDDQGRLGNLLLHAPDGRLRLRNLLDGFRPHYDLLLIDTQGARSVTVEMAVLACDLALSPVTPEMLAARELRRGTLKLLSELEPFRHLGIVTPPLRLLLNQVNAIKRDSRMIMRSLRDTFVGAAGIGILDTMILDRVAYLNAASLGLPVHRVEMRSPAGRSPPSALGTMQALAIELFPEWRDAVLTINAPKEIRR